ncbi:MAG: SMR domain protein [Xanthomonadales bacterium]|nr:Smr/MutS family protein [Gammaproteobacteria bacterium]NNE05064.1 SMR domain protein [Xanthomonadales bacterium]NNL96121.1 SMR domain protein [Xanthomonadales bacterium]
MDLFRLEFEDVQPLNSVPRSDSRPPRPAPAARQRQLDEQAVLTELLESPSDPAEFETGEELLFLRSGYQRRYLTRLRRGRYSIEDSIDLHHMNESTASAAIMTFIDHALDRGLGCVRIVHGKGLRSRNGPKLKILARRLLSRHPSVIAFASCKPSEGGTGAVLVLLRNRRRRPQT